MYTINIGLIAFCYKNLSQCDCALRLILHTNTIGVCACLCAHKRLTFNINVHSGHFACPKCNSCIFAEAGCNLTTCTAPSHLHPKPGTFLYLATNTPIQWLLFSVCFYSFAFLFFPPRFLYPLTAERQGVSQNADKEHP